MDVITLDFKAPSLDVSRMFPCVAGGIGPFATTCGATPASLWRRTCRNKHEALVRLCGNHALLIARAHGMCRVCSDHGFAVAITIEPVEILLAKK